MKGVSISDQQRWHLQLHGRRIPCALWCDLEQADRLVGQINDWWVSKQQEAHALCEDAYREGFQQGLQQANDQAMEAVLLAQARAQAFLQESEARVLGLARAVLARVLPRLSEQDVITELLATALREVRAERYLRIRVHPDQLAQVHQRLKEWRYQAFAVPAVEVVPDPGLTRLGCVVESEQGSLQAGLDEQLAVVFSGLRRCLPPRPEHNPQHNPPQSASPNPQ